jgi:pyruvate/2-oxoglutarate dehydrogenase complex dihydrolipoamide dehydrogenase (E3) component
MRYDAIVIGSGQGGNPLAHKLADQGWSVALIEKEHLGGTCVNTGCTPTKTMVARAQVAHYVRNAARWGVHAGEVTVDLRPVAQKRQGGTKLSRRPGAECQQPSNPPAVPGKARFSGPHTVTVGDQTLEGERIFINTGTHPTIPDIEGLDATGYLTNATH